MRERNSENLWAINQSFLFDLFQVFVVEFVGNGYMHVIPPGVSGLVTANEQDGRATWVKCVQNAKRPTVVLCA